jgi:hypothetical protein
MRISSLFVAATALLTLICGTSARAAAPHACTKIQDDRERLACYDHAFGTPAEPKVIPDPMPVAAPPPEKFSAKVTKVDWRNGVFTVELDNGQVWLQRERDTRVQIEVGETVSIRPASLGSFLLSSDQGIAARVKRLR